MEPASGAEEGKQTLVDIDESDVIPLLVASEERLSFFSGNADPGVQNVNLVEILVLDEADFDSASLGTLEDAVDDCIFHERLQQEGRNEDGGELILRQVIGDLQAVAEAGPFQLDVAVDDVKLIGEGNEFRRVIQAVPEIIGQILDELPRRFRIAPDIVGNGIQRVVQEMGIDLGLQSPDFRFGKKIFLFLHFVIFVDGFHDMADPVEELRPHAGEGIALAFGGDDVAYGFMVVQDRQSVKMGHRGEGLLQIQDGDFCSALVLVGVILVVGPGVDFVIIKDRCPDQIRKGGGNDISHFGKAFFLESVMQGGEKSGNGIKGDFGGLGLLGVSLADEKFDDHVEKRDGNRIGHDNRQGEGEEVLRMAACLRPGEKGKEKPEGDFQDARGQQGPEPELVVMVFQTVCHESGSNALDDGKTSVDEGRIGVDEKGSVKADDDARNGADHRPSDEAGHHDAHGTEIDDPPAGFHIPVGPAEGQGGEEGGEHGQMLRREILGCDGLAEKIRPGNEEQNDQGNGNPEPYMLDAEHP